MRFLLQHENALSNLYRLLSRIDRQRKNRILILILVTGLVQGLIYTFLIPPWWHYDEPTHFETAWLISNRPGWPKTYERAVREKIVISMIKYDYYKTMNAQPDLGAKRPDWIGFTNPATDTPGYFILASLPLRLLREADVAVQNRAARLMSLAMFLLTLWIAWKAFGELLPEDHPVRWMGPLFMTLLPGFADTMTSINDDVGAVLAFSLFSWVGLRLIQRGFSWPRLAALGFALTACYWAKSTAWPALPLALVPVLFALFRQRRRWIPWALVILTGAGGLLFALRWDDAALWYRRTTQAETTRVLSEQAPFGRYAFRLQYNAEQSPQIGQFVTIEQMRTVRNRTVTLGAWMWASEPVTVRLPVLRMAIYRAGITNSPVRTVSLTTVPMFYSITFDVPFEAESGWLELIPKPRLQKGQSVTIYYDGVVLAEGEHYGSPNFADPFARGGNWDGQSFQNLVRNASAETAWLWLSPAMSNTLLKIFRRGYPDVALASIQDFEGSARFYQATASTLLQTFWARLARDKVGLLGEPLIYPFLYSVFVLGLVGVPIFIGRRVCCLPWPSIFFLGMALFTVWGIAAIRGGIELLSRSPAIPWARYAFPAIIPTALLLCAGWWEGLRWLGRWLRLSSWQQGAIFVAFMLGLDIFALLSIAKYFYWKEGQEYVFLLALTALLLYLALASFHPRLNKGVEN